MTIRDPKAKLRAALDVIDHYNDALSKQPLANVFPSQKKNTGIGVSVRLAFHLIASAFSLKAKHKGVQAAIDDVKRHHPSLTDDRRLLDRTFSSIQKFNQALDESQESNKISWHHKLFRFFINKSSLRHKITLPTKPLQPFHHLNPAQTQCLSKQEEDAFRMKAFTLIKKYGIIFPSIEEALKTIRETPIDATIECSSLSASSVLYLRQTLTPFPGETIILRGAINRNPGSPIPSTPIPESFALTNETTPSGFPDPLQHTGWALSEVLIPGAPHRPDAMPSLNALLQKKRETARFLKEQPAFKQRAQKLLKIKMKHPAPLFDLHQRLFSTLAPDSAKEIATFFDWLKQRKDPLETLAAVSRKFNQKCLIEPSQTLMQAWNSPSKDQSRRAAQTIIAASFKKGAEELTQSLADAAVQEFQRVLAEHIGMPAQELLLQHASEIMQFPPLPLSQKAKALQSLALIQLEAYLKELNEEIPQPPQTQLLYEIEALEKGHLHPLVETIGSYYSSCTRNI